MPKLSKRLAHALLCAATAMPLLTTTALAGGNGSLFSADTGMFGALQAAANAPRPTPLLYTDAMPVTVEITPDEPVETLHLADNLPFGHERRLISLLAAPEAESADFAVQPVGSWLLSRTPWTEAEHRISAISADRETAQALLLPSGSACLRLERKTWRDGTGVTWAWQTFPGDAYDLVARFSPTGA